MSDAATGLRGYVRSIEDENDRLRQQVADLRAALADAELLLGPCEIDSPTVREVVKDLRRVLDATQPQEVQS